MIKLVVTVLLAFAIIVSYYLLDTVDVDNRSVIDRPADIDLVTNGERFAQVDPVPRRSRSRKTATAIGRATPPSSGPAEAVNFRNGLLSVQVQRKPLVWVLEQVARAIQVSIVNAPELSEESVSIEFQDLPLLDGLQRLLNPWDTFFLFAGGSDRQRLQAVWVYPEGKGQEIAPIPASEWASTEELERGLSDTDPRRRAESLEAVAARSGQKAAGYVLRALQDSHDQVRLRALDTALNVGVELSADTIIGLAQTDPAAEIRVIALDRLSELASSKADIDIRPILENALNDPDQSVRYKAKYLLDVMVEMESHQDTSEQPL